MEEFLRQWVTRKPINDLRCFKNKTQAQVACLFIMGHLTDAFADDLKRTEVQLQETYKRPISIKVIDERRVAELYLRYMAGDSGSV